MLTKHPDTDRRPKAAALTVTFALSAVAVAGVMAYRDRAVSPPSVAYAAARKKTPAPPPPKLALPPNELGRVPILMYHSVGDPPLTGKLARFSRYGLSISADLFRQHLQTLYDGGFYPVNMRDLLSPHLAIPAGKTPVVLTFDDARVSQFRYHKDGLLDPNCVIGILEAFHKKHLDWPERASFYVLPDSKYNPPPFGQKPLVKQKLAYLYTHGYEIANHSTTHHPMARMSAQTLQWELATCARYFHQMEPRLPMDTMALPYGISPNKALLPVLLDDAAGDYHNRCILLAAGDASYAPLDRRFDKLRVMRIGSEPGNIERWLKVLIAERKAATSKGKLTLRPYISDGDPDTLAVPQSLAKYVDKTRVEGIKIVGYADAPLKTKPPKTQVATHHLKRG